MNESPISQENLKLERKEFGRQLFAVVTPMMVQNLLITAVSAADVVMLGFIGQTAIAAASLANYIQFVSILFYSGLSSGVIMLAAQYWGKNDTYSIETIFGIGAKLSAVVGIIFSLLSGFFPEFLMRIFTNNSELIQEGAKYLRIVSLSYLCLSVSSIYQAALKSIERVKTVTIITTAALLLNIFGNAVFIFGIFGAPKLGIRGVALATTIARIIEVALCIVVALRIKTPSLGLACLFRKNKILFKDFIKYSLPAIGNEAVWGAGWATYAVIMGHLSADLVAANSLVNTLRNLATIACFGLAYGGAIVIGKEIGAEEYDVAKRNASRLVRITILSGVVGVALLLICRPLLFKMAKLEPAAREMLNPLLYINCLSVLGASINTVLIAGIFRAGGDAKFGFVLDTIMMWCISIPAGLVAVFVLRLPPVAVYFVLYIDEWLKMVAPVTHYKSGKWLKNITRDFARAG